MISSLKAYTKQKKNKIRNEIIECASLYEHQLAQREFLIIAEGRVFPVVFKRENFGHLCGISTNTGAQK